MPGRPPLIRIHISVTKARHSTFVGFNAAYLDTNRRVQILRLIENQTLLKQLMSLYTVSIPFQIEADRQLFDERRRFYDEHIGPRATFLSGDLESMLLAASKKWAEFC